MNLIIGLLLFISLTGEGGDMFWKRKAQDKCEQLISAVLDGKVDKVRQAISEGAGINCKDRAGVPALIIAASRHEREIVNALLSGGADPNVTYNNPEQGYRQTPAINFPAANGDLSILNALLSAGASVNARDASGLTPLMSAAFMGHEDVAEALLEKGAE